MKVLEVKGDRVALDLSDKEIIMILDIGEHICPELTEFEDIASKVVEYWLFLYILNKA